jgi:hypothetical protein
LSSAFGRHFWLLRGRYGTPDLIAAGYRSRSRRNSRLAADDKQVADEEHSDK